MIFQILSTGLDHFQGIDITFVSSVTPGEQSMRAQHDPADTGIFVEAFFQFQSQVEARTLPFHPADLAPKQFLRDLPAIPGRSYGNRRIGMQVVDMRKRKETMEG